LIEFRIKIVTDLSFMLQTCYGLGSNTTGKLPTWYGLAMGKLRGK